MMEVCGVFLSQMVCFVTWQVAFVVVSTEKTKKNEKSSGRYF